ncbi:MAG: hypothetical protein U0797_29745 [Gemmataceae bacterium]
MARMSREFHLVLLGAGLLTAGSFLWPEEDPAKRAEQEAAAGGGGGTNGRARTSRVFFVTSFTRPSAPAPSAAGATSRGGFGRVGGAFSGGG